MRLLCGSLAAARTRGNYRVEGEKAIPIRGQALTSPKHGKSLLEGIGYCRDLAKESAHWLTQWLLRHGIKEPEEELHPGEVEKKQHNHP